MELRHLRYFLAVAETLNFRRAAERLRISAPTLSKQVRNLEEELEVPLFDRDTGGVRLTEGGAAFLPEARLLLARSSRAIEAAREAANGRGGRIAIGYVEPIFMGFMPECLAAFHRKFPAVEVVLVEMPLREQLAAVEAGSVQIGFVPTGGEPLPRGFRRARVAQSLIRVAIGRPHRLFRASNLALADLVGERLLCLGRPTASGAAHEELTRRLFAVRGLELGPVRRIDGSEAFRAEVAGGLGISLIPTVGHLSQSRAIVRKPLVDVGADLFVGLDAVWREASSSRITQNFIAQAREVAREEKLLGSE